VEDYLYSKARSLGPATVNHLRVYIRRIFNAAINAERFFGKNPVTRDVKKRPVPRRKPQYLLPDEVLPVLAAVPDRWRAAFALGIYAGLRKGEILGLRKDDVDLSGRMIMVRRSHGADTPKGGHEEGVPIAAELLPYLEDAMASSNSDWVFPHPKGGRHPEGTDLVSIIRTALRRSQIVSGWVHKCRRKGCGFSIETADGEQRRCPHCNFKLWPTAKVRPLRFHDTRHTTASLLMMFGANPAAVQRILRHTDIRLTVEVYGHLAPNYLRSEIDLLAFQKPDPGEPDPEPPDRPAITGASRTFASPVLQK
jgi:integrase